MIPRFSDRAVVNWVVLPIPEGRLIKLRKLAAIDITFLGYGLIFAEYAGGVFLSLGLGLFVLFRSHSYWQVLLGIYFIGLGTNYVPMLVYAATIGGIKNAQAELGDELTDRRRAMAKYRRQSLVLLVPLLALLLVFIQTRRRPHDVK